MCGITAFLGCKSRCNPRDVFGSIFNGLTILQNRGYDSAGICTIADSKLIITKYASTSTECSLELVKKHHGDKVHKGHHLVGIGHTRWATHGAKTNANAHPHTDNRNRIALVHNGIIENYATLKEKLLNLKYILNSQTDSEVIAVLIGYYLDIGFSFHESMKKTVDQLEGTWGLVMIHKDMPNTLFISKNGSPLLIGFGQFFCMVASEQSALQNCHKYICLENSCDIVSICLKESYDSLDEFLQHADTCFKTYKMKALSTSTKSPLKLSPFPYTHWTKKEIMDQPNSVLNAINHGGRIFNNTTVHLGGLISHVNTFLNAENLLLIGCGTSHYACMVGSRFFCMLKTFNTVQVLDASEFSIEDIPYFNTEKTIVIALSQSGETKDVHRAIELATRNGIFVCGVVNVVDSLIARESDCGVYTNAGREVAVASTKSFTNQCIVLVLISLWVSQQRHILTINNKKLEQSIQSDTQDENDFTKKKENSRLDTKIVQSLLSVSSAMYDMLNGDLSIEKVLNNTKVCELFARSENFQKRIFFLGRNKAHGIAMEGALKLKEIAYVHAEGYAGGALKHGPFALIENGTVIILFILDDEEFPKMVSAAEETKSRGAFHIIITNVPERIPKHLSDMTIPVPNIGILSFLLCIIPIQLLAYKIACIKGLNPDRPRNLAKVVTVDG